MLDAQNGKFECSRHSVEISTGTSPQTSPVIYPTRSLVPQSETAHQARQKLSLTNTSTAFQSSHTQ